MKKFDLNIEKILENWEVCHAIREIIANALDEQLLSNTKDVEIFKEGNSWIIRDFGRGLKYTHLTQNENQEKLKNPNIIGKFGIGLKDALATFDRRGISLTINSRHNQITISKSEKEGFNDIITLHALIAEPKDKNFIGTEFILKGVNDNDIEKAKEFFLKFSEEKILENTKFGQIIEKKNKFGNIYINGLKVAEEENFLFSYNITSLTSSIKKALNRERTNVGRAAYSDSIKKILLASKSKEVAGILAKELTNIDKGTACDELTWIDIQEHAVKVLNQQGKCVFISSKEAMEHPDMIDEADDSGYEIIIIPEKLKDKIKGLKDYSGNPIVDIGEFINIYNNSFEFNFINPENLTQKEKEIYSLTPKIIDFFGGKPKKVKEIKISTTMQKDFFSKTETLGCWDEKTNSIVISRKVLKSIQDYSGTLIHELIHAKTDYDDVTREFENELTATIGKLCAMILKNKGK